MAWRVAESLETLRKQLNEAFPKRSKASDGGIGDAKHASRSSDHNPWVKDKKGVGIVTARDFTHDPKTGIDCQWLADTLVKNKDPRIKYIIWNHQICSSATSPWKWRPYSGVNAHTKHLHLSVSDAATKYDSTKAWKLGFPSAKSNDVAKVSAAVSPDRPAEDVKLPDPPDAATKPAADIPGTTQIADNIVNTAPAALPPPEDKDISAPTKDGATATATKMTIAGIVVPGFIVGLIKTVQELIAQGYVSAAEVGSTVLTFIRENQRYVFILIGVLILLLIVKKVVKQITFWIEMLTKAIPGWNNITVIPTEVKPVEKRWWEVWK